MWSERVYFCGFRSFHSKPLNRTGKSREYNIGTIRAEALALNRYLVRRASDLVQRAEHAKWAEDQREQRLIARVYKYVYERFGYAKDTVETGYF